MCFFRSFLFALIISAVLTPLHALGNSDQDRGGAAKEPAFAKESAGRGSAESTIPPSAPGAAPAPPAPDAEIITIRGVIRLLGNEPFPELVLTDSDGSDWYLDGDAKEKTRPYQHREITLRGQPEYKEMTLANGMSMGMRRFLRDAVILE
jgi:hypothetical protein